MTKEVAALVAIDSPYVKVHSDGIMLLKSPQSIGKSRRGNTTRIHVADVDDKRKKLPCAFLISQENVSNRLR